LGTALYMLLTYLLSRLVLLVGRKLRCQQKYDRQRNADD